MVLNHPDKTKEVLPSNSTISGMVVDVNVRSNVVEGKEIHNLAIMIEDGEEAPVQVSVALGSFFAAKIVGLLNGADLRQPITLAVNTVKVGDMMGDKVVEANNAYPTIRQGPKQDRVEYLYANGESQLPATPVYEINGEKHRDMAAVTEVVAPTIQQIFEKLDRIIEEKKQSHAGGHDEGIPADELAEAAQFARQSQQRARA